MTNRQESKLKMFRVVIAVFQRYNAILTTVPALSQAYDDFKALVTRIESLHPLQSGNHTGITRDKDQLREDVTDLAVVLSGFIYNYAGDNDNHDLLIRMDLQPSDFRRATVADFIKKCTSVIDECQKAGDALNTYGYSAETLNRFTALVDEFKAASSKPREAIVERSVATESLAQQFSLGMSILENKTDRLMPQFQYTQPEFYREYKNARIIVDPAMRSQKTTNETPAAKA